MNDDETSARLLLFVAGQQRSVQGRNCEGANVYTQKRWTPFFRCHDSGCDAELK